MPDDDEDEELYPIVGTIAWLMPDNDGDDDEVEPDGATTSLS